MNKKKINFENLNNNLQQYSCKKVCAMVKANAYGHGVKEIAVFLRDKVDCFGVCCLQEAVELRKYCTNKIIIMTPISQIDLYEKNNFDFVVDDLKTLKKICDKNLLHRVHIKINCGMNRFGFGWNDKKLLKKINKICEGKKIGGICTHFSTLSNKKVTQREYDKFCFAKALLKLESMVHFGGSDIINYDFDYDMIRVGIGLYYQKNSQVLTLISKIQKVKILEYGMVGYDGIFKIDKKTKIGILPIGYADGFSKRFLGVNLLLNGVKCKVVGNICMDCCFVDITGANFKDNQEIIVGFNINEICNFTKMSKYEILTNFNMLREKNDCGKS